MNFDFFNFFKKDGISYDYVYQALINTSPAMMLITDLTGKVLFINDNFAKELNFDSGEQYLELLKNVNVRDLEIKFLDVADADTDYYIKKLLSEGVLQDIKYRRKVGVNEEKIFSITATVIYSQKNEPKYFFGSVRNITQQEYENEDKYSREKLNSLAVMAGGIAHDFNNMLTGIVTHIDLAILFLNSVDKIVAEKIKKNLHQSQQAAQQAKYLVEQLLQFSKQNKEITYNSHDIRKLIYDTMEFTLRGKNIDVVYDIEDTKLEVYCNPTQVLRILTNLALNSQQAIYENRVTKGTINIRVYKKHLPVPNLYNLPEGLYVIIKIKDNGGGIPKSIQNKIFDPYFTTKKEGTGLGLASVYSIVKNHKGYIAFKVEENESTEFSVYLPAKNGAILPEIVSSKKRVLIVDDDIEIGESLRELLEKVDYHAEICINADCAGKIYEQFLNNGTPFDVILTDLSLSGGINGIDLLKYIRSVDLSSKIVLITGYNEERQEVANYKQHGFNALLLKPFRLEQLMMVLDTLLNPEGDLNVS